MLIRLDFRVGIAVSIDITVAVDLHIPIGPAIAIGEDITVGLKITVGLRITIGLKITVTSRTLRFTTQFHLSYRLVQVIDFQDQIRSEKTRFEWFECKIDHRLATLRNL